MGKSKMASQTRLKKGKAKSDKPLPFLVFPHAEKTDISPATASQLSHPFRLLMVGPPSCGKRNLCFNIVQSFDPRPERIVVVHMEASSKEYDGVATEIHGPSSNFSFKSLIPDKKDEDDPDAVLDECPPRTLVILDELDIAKMKATERGHILDLLRYGSSHLNTSVIIQYQLFSGADLNVRQLCSALTIWPGIDARNHAHICQQYGLDLTELRELLRLCQDPRESLTIDFAQNRDGPYRHRLNWVWPIQRKKKGKALEAPRVGGSVVVIAPPAGDLAEPERDAEPSAEDEGGEEDAYGLD